MKSSEGLIVGVIAQRVERALGALALLSYRKPRTTLSLLAVVTAIGAYAAKDLRVDADLGGLIPKTFQSIQDLERLTERFGSTGWVVVAGRDAEPDELIRFAEESAPKLAELEHIRYVDFRRQSKFFEDRKLYFLSEEDLGVVRDRIAARVEFETQLHNPMFMVFDDPPSLDFSDLEEKYARQQGGGSWLKSQTSGTYYIDNDDRIIVLQAKPADQSLDLDYTRTMLTEVRDLFAATDLTTYGPDMKVQLAGRYRARVDMQNAIERDLGVVSIFATLAMLLYLGVHFRRIFAVILIMVPLAIGVVWCFGFATVAFGTLNILTSFIGVILLGLGIDHGIHLLGRFETEFREDRSAEEAMRITFSETGRAIVIAAITTMVAFLCLAISEFRAFHEFGSIAGLGMAAMVIAYTTCLPALLALALARGWRPRVPADAPVSTWPGFVTRHKKPLVIVSAVIIAIFLALAPGARFNYDLGALEANELETSLLNVKVQEILGFPDGPSALLTSSLEEERYLAKALRARKAMKQDSTIAMVAASSDLLPDNQAAKQILIRQIGKVVARIKPKAIKDPVARQQFTELLTLVAAEPFTRADLPQQAQALFGGSKGGSEGFVLAFPNTGKGSGTKIMEFADELRAVKLPNGNSPPIAGDDMVVADILDMIIRESPPIALWTVIAIFLTLMALLTRLRYVLLCLLPPTATLILTFGLLPVVGLQVNYINIVMFPILFGVGVDGGAHLITRLGAGEKFETVISDTGRAIAGAILTTSLGFGALMMANHAGLNSLGKMALIGLGANLLVCLVALPAVLAFIRWEKSPA